MHGSHWNEKSTTIIWSCSFLVSHLSLVILVYSGLA
jgi:hypothetical protein